MEVLIYKSVSELATIGDAWDHLSELEPRFVPSFSELLHELETSASEFRVLVAVDGSQVFGIACFVYRYAKKPYFIGEINLFHLPIKEVSLFGSCVLGRDEHVIEMILRPIINDSNFDLLDLGYIIVDSPLYNVVTKLRGGVIVSRASRSDQIQWLVKLPDIFEAYTRSLGRRTRRNTVREFKKRERQSVFTVHVIHRLDEIDKFLHDAEKVSRLTYQWNLGAKFCDDGGTRERLTRFAKNQKLRCYIAYCDDQPCAFAYGEWRDRIYVLRQMGYDPKYASKSPGTSLLLRTIGDLIDNTDCEFLDFGAGGYFEYKTRFANTSLNCVRLQVGQLFRPYSIFLIALDQLLNSAKNLLSLIIGQGKLMQTVHRYRVKRLRRYSDG